MRKNLLYYANLFSSHRELKTFAIPRPEIIFSNNHSAIYFTLASFLKHGGKHVHPDLKVIIPPTWLDTIHKDYDNNQWGQGLFGLPWTLRKDFIRLYPDYNDGPIFWKQVKELRLESINNLKMSGIPVFVGQPILKKQNDGYLLHVENETFELPTNTHFYNAYRDLNVKHNIEGLPNISCTNLYEQPQLNAPRNAVMLGGNGRTGIWLAQHFPNTLFNCVTNGQYPKLFPGESFPSNLLFYNQERYSLEASKSKPGHAVIYDKILNNPVAIGSFYCSIGFSVRSDITACVVDPDNNLTTQPTSQWSAKWFSAEEIPVGSLLEATARWVKITENTDWSFELHSFHGTTVIDLLAKKLKDQGITLPHSFCNILVKKITENFNCPSDEETIKIYRESFEEVFSSHSEKLLIEKCVCIVTNMAMERTYQPDNYLMQEDQIDTSAHSFNNKS